MNLPHSSNVFPCRASQASVLVVVLWVCLGLVAVSLYFANSMTYELRAADNRTSGLAADQAIEGAARYVGSFLQNYATNGMSMLPDSTAFPCENVAIGNCHFWIIGRHASDSSATDPAFGLVDEGAKFNLNYANTNFLLYLPNMTYELAGAIQGWRGTNGILPLNYASQGYYEKNLPFETVDELRLVSGADMSLLYGDDLNLNGVLDANEKDTTGTGQVSPGLLEYTTVYSREPNFLNVNGVFTNLVNINTASIRRLGPIFATVGISSSYLNSITASRPYAGLMAVAARCRQNGLSDSQVAALCTNITTATGAYIRGRINVNTASTTVLTALFEGLNNGDESTASADAQTLVSYRDQNTNNLSSLAWVYDALGTGNSTLRRLERGDYITTQSYQFTADIAAVGPNGRGYRRVRFVFDISNGFPQVIYRQDLGGLGWALGDKVRQKLLADNLP